MSEETKVSIKESCDFYYIQINDGVYCQRKHQNTASESPLNGFENVIIALCKGNLETNKPEYCTNQ